MGAFHTSRHPVSGQPAHTRFAAVPDLSPRSAHTRTTSARQARALGPGAGCAGVSSCTVHNTELGRPSPGRLPAGLRRHAAAGHPSGSAAESPLLRRNARRGRRPRKSRRRSDAAPRARGAFAPPAPPPAPLSTPILPWRRCARPCRGAVPVPSSSASVGGMRPHCGAWHPPGSRSPAAPAFD